MDRLQLDGRTPMARTQGLIRILAALAVLGCGVFLWVSARMAVCHPILDMIPLLNDWLESPSGIAGTLWLPLNEHHLVWLRILTPADFLLTSGWPVLSGVSSLLLTASLVTVPAWALWRAGMEPWLRYAGVALLVLLVIAPPAAEDTAIVINGVYPQAAGFAMLGLGAAAAGRWGIGFVLAVLAALGNGVGLVMLPILPWLAWRGGNRPRVVLALTLAGGAAGLIYLAGMPRGQHRLPELWVALRYAATMLGLPASHSSHVASMAVLGWLPGAVLGALGMLALARRPETPIDRLAQGGILFGLGAAVLGALARTDLAGGLPALRYTLLVLPLQIGLLCLALQWAQPMARRRPAVAATILLILGVALLAQSALAGRAMVAALAEQREAVMRFAAGDRSIGLEPFIYPDLGLAEKVWSDLSARGVRFCR